VEVLRLGEEGRKAAVAALVTAFAADPLARWTLADPGDYLSLFPLVLHHMGGAAFAHMSAFATADRRAAALWLPPGVAPDLEGLASAFAAAGIEGPGDGPAFFAEMARTRPHAPHWYLPFIGVDPAAQGRGLGTALMQAALAEVDASGLPAYLESTNPRNVPLYARLGFRVVGEIQLGASPLVHRMWRDAPGG